MNKFNKILVAIDFSDISAKAFTTAVDLAKRLDASLHVAHIVQIHAMNIPESGAIQIEELEAIEEQAASENMDKYVKQHGDGVAIIRTIVHGDPAVQINNIVKETGADMIVMGTHGRSGLAHLVMGSVAETVLRNAEVPVMCVKGG